MANFLTSLKSTTNYTRTENGAVARATTKSNLLDFFALGGALRSRTEKDVEKLLQLAIDEDPLLATKCLFYFRDVRGGQGERKTFRTGIHYLATRYPEYLVKNLELIPEFGRWDDLLVLLDTKLGKDVMDIVRKQLSEDVESLKVSKRPVSLLAKWMPSENASSPKTKAAAHVMMSKLALSPRVYRKALSSLRQRIDVVERLMSAKEFGKINYEGVPSKAMLQYRHAFNKQDAERFSAYMESVTKGEKTIKADTLYPYDIVRKCLAGESGAVLDAQWKALRDFCEGVEDSTLVVVDVSDSMFSVAQSPLPIEVSISLGLYLAERNKGMFHNHYISFSSKPTLIQVTGKTISDKVRFMQTKDVGYDTNVEAVFNLILKTAIANHTPQEELPARVLLISDMEFNHAISGRTDVTLFKGIQQKFESAGYTMPTVVFWNVAARNTQFPMTMDDRGVLFVSGASPSIFEAIAKGEYMDAYSLMLSVLNKPRYSAITIE